MKVAMRPLTIVFLVISVVAMVTSFQLCAYETFQQRFTPLLNAVKYATAILPIITGCYLVRRKVAVIGWFVAVMGLLLVVVCLLTPRL